MQTDTMLFLGSQCITTPHLFSPVHTAHGVIINCRCERIQVWVSECMTWAQKNSHNNSMGWVRYWVLGSAPHLIDYTYELFIRLQLSLFFEDFACVSCCELHALLHLQVDPYRALQAIAHTLTHSPTCDCSCCLIALALEHLAHTKVVRIKLEGRRLWFTYKTYGAVQRESVWRMCVGNREQ